MSFPNPTINIGSASARAEHAGDLGKTIVVDGKTYRMVRSATTIAAAANKVLVIGSLAVAAAGLTASVSAAGQNVILFSSTTGVAIGQRVSGIGVPAGAWVTAFTANTSVTISANLTAATTASAYLFTSNSDLVAPTTTAATVGVSGVVPAGQTNSAGAAGLILGDFFYIQVGGEATPIITATSVAAGTGLTTHTTTGECAAVSPTYAATTGGALFAVTRVTGSGTASQPTRALLQGLI